MSYDGCCNSVLKKRETRLKREQDGLKSLLSGLVGGPALLKEWEREWRERFGGEEKDEIEDDPAMGAGTGGSDDEDGDGDDSDGDDEDGEEGRARKKAKVATKAKKEKPLRLPNTTPRQVAPIAPLTNGVGGAVPEKRKRGRPRKNPLPPGLAVPTSAPALTSSSAPMPIVLTTDDVVMQQQYAQMHQHQQPTQQFLLAAFAFFSVFNSPITSRYSHSSSHAHDHHGSVLTHHTPGESHNTTASGMKSVSAYGIHEFIQAAHLLVSTLVLFYVIIPWLSSAFRRTTPRLASFFSFSNRMTTCPAPPASPSPTFPTFTFNLLAAPTINQQSAAATLTKVPSSQHETCEKLMDALSARTRGSADEGAVLRAALGIRSGLVGLLHGVYRATCTRARAEQGIEHSQLEQRAWVRLGEIVALGADKPEQGAENGITAATRLQTYVGMSWHISRFAVSTTDLATLALIILPVFPSRASVLWERACVRVKDGQGAAKVEEKMVLECMGVEEAAGWLERWRVWRESADGGKGRKRCAACERRTPLGVLGAILVRERLRKHAAALFVRTVVPARSREDWDEYGEDVAEGDAYVFDAEREWKDEQERKETVAAGRSIGGRTAELAILLERIWETGWCAQDDIIPLSTSSVSHPHSHAHTDADADAEENDDDNEEQDCTDSQEDLASTDESEIRTLLRATLVYRRLFPSTSSLPSCNTTAVPFVLSPPPSPSRKNAELHVTLRAALGSPAFEYGQGHGQTQRHGRDGSDAKLENEKLSAALEDARDRVVDMLVDLERACRRGRY